MSRRGSVHAVLHPLAAALLVACGSGEGGSTSGSAAAESQGVLSSAEYDGLVFTREEEKLARDVYTVLQARDPSFSNIRASEQTHMDAIGTLLARYAIADPAAGKAIGEFTNPTLQALHDALVAQGLPSRVAALSVGVEIEELDIHDIELANEAVSHDDILNTYDNLTRGSRNHLRAFYRQLLAAGGTYTSRHLDAATFQAIVTSATERGP
jgi:hypothetical protein